MLKGVSDLRINCLDEKEIGHVDSQRLGFFVGRKLIKFSIKS